MAACRYLNRNSLTRLTQGALQGLKMLQVLEVKENVITSIEDGAFKDLSSLYDLCVNQCFVCMHMRVCAAVVRHACVRVCMKMRVCTMCARTRAHVAVRLVCQHGGAPSRVAARARLHGIGKDCVPFLLLTFGHLRGSCGLLQHSEKQRHCSPAAWCFHRTYRTGNLRR